MSRLTLKLTQPPIQWVPGPFSVREKQLECEDVYTPSYNNKVLNAYCFISTTLLPFTVWCLGPGESLLQYDR